MSSVKPLSDGAMVAIAHKIISFAGDLPPSAKKVGAALLEHRNRASKRCDPSEKTLAGMCGIGERTVKRAVEKLSTSEIFVVARHGGLGNRNSYSLNFAEVARRNLQMQERKARARRSRSPPEVAPETGREWPLDGARIDTQTYNINPSEETYGSTRAQSPCLSSPISSIERQPPLTPSQAPDLSRQADTSGPTSRALASPRTRTSPVRDTSFGNAAEQSAMRRWDRDLREFFGSDVEGYANAIEFIDPAIADAATGHEMKRRGEGVRYVVARLASQGLSIRADAAPPARRDTPYDGGDNG